MRLSAIALVCVSVLLTLCAPVRAQSPDPNLQAEPQPIVASLGTLFDSIAAKQWDVARAIANALDDASDEGDIMAAFVTASMLTDKGQCVSSLPLAKAIVTASPYFLPAYDLAAKCMVQEGKKDEAAAMFRDVASTIPDAGQRDLLLARADALVPSLKPRYIFDAVAQPSTNINRGTYETDLKGWSVPQQSREKSGTLITATAEIEKPLLISSKWLLAGSLRFGVSYNTLTGGHTPTVRTAFSATRVLSNKTSIKFKPYVEVGFAKSDYLYTRPGIELAWNHMVSPRTTLGATLDASWIVYENKGSDGLSARLSTTARTIVTPNDRINTQAWVSVSEKEAKSQNNVAVGAEIEWEHAYKNGIIGSLALGGHLRAHERSAALEDEKQRDYAAYVRLGVSHQKVKIGKIRPELTYTYTQQWSNDVFSRYDAHDVGVRFKASF